MLVGPMKILYAISVANFVMLMWVAFALSRHVRRTRAELELATSEPAVPHSLQLRREHEVEPDVERKPALPERRTQPDRRQSYESLYAQYMAEQHAAMTGTDGPVGIVPDFAQSRKIRYATMGRLDPAYFNKDAGDLTDPEAPPRPRANPSHSPRTPRRYS